MDKQGPGEGAVRRVCQAEGMASTKPCKCGVLGELQRVWLPNLST